MYIYSRYKSYKNPPFLTKQRVFLVRPMRFERTAFGVGAGLSIDSPRFSIGKVLNSNRIIHFIPTSLALDSASRIARTPKRTLNHTRRTSPSFYLHVTKISYQRVELLHIFRPDMIKNFVGRLFFIDT